MVGLQTAAQSSRQADGGVAVGGDGDFGGGVDEIQIAHELAHRRRHFRGQAPAQSVQVGTTRPLVKDILPKLGHRPALDPLIDRQIQIVLDDPGDLVGLIGHCRILPQLLKGHPRQHHLGRHPLLGGFRREPCQLVPGFFLVGLGKHLL